MMVFWLRTAGLGLTRISDCGLISAVWIILPLCYMIICHVDGAKEPVASQCNNATEFTCVNGNCIPLEKVNNTVNDCLDNSDEVAAGKACRKGSFSCLNGYCRPPSWVLDGSDDCGDKSDEAKIIGMDCSMVKRDWDTGEVFGCCDCDVYVPNSECVNNTHNITCQCQSGFYSNELGTNCIRRVIGDLCETDADCYDAFANSSCVDNACICDVGYYDSVNASHCVPRIIGDPCAIDEDCSTVVANSNCTRDQCMCNSGFYRSDNFSTCLLREIGEGCRYDHECYGVGNSTCIAGRCTCGRGYKNDLGPRICNMRTIGESCLDHLDCPVIGSACVNGTCSCRIGRHASDDRKFCPLRVVGDLCETDRDCSASFLHSYCAEKSEVRMCYCDVGFYGPVGSTRCFPIDNITDVILLAINVFIIGILVIIIIWLIIYFKQAYDEKVIKLKQYKEKQLDYCVVPLEDREIKANSH